jgi:hypothetical protein
LHCKWVLPGGSSTTIRHNTQNTQNNTPLSNKTTHKATQTIKEHITHNEYNTKKKEKSKTIPVTGHGGLHG